MTEILVGSDPDCHLVVDLPGVSPIHARIWADLDQSVVYETRAPRGLFVNADRVEGQAPIGEGDVLWLGPPVEPDSVCVKLLFEPWVERLPLAGPDLWDAPAEPASAEPGEPEPGEPEPGEPEPGPDAQIGDTVTLLGSADGDTITANELAAWAETIPYEIICRVSPRVPRVYLRSGKVEKTRTLLDHYNHG